MLPYIIGVLLIGACARRVTPVSRWAALALVAMPLLFTGRALLTGGVYGPIDLAYTSEPLASAAANQGVRSVKDPEISDVYVQFMPWRDALRRSIVGREWPLWNPYELCGDPLAGTAQSAPYHPFTLLGLLAPLPQSFAATAALMFFSAATFAFLLFREFVRSEAAALFGAFAWMASTHVVFFAGTALVLASSAIPLVLLGARRVAREPSRKSAAILTAALLLVIFAGHPESVLHDVAFGVAYFVFEAWSGGTLRQRRIYAAGLSAGIAALLLSAIFLLPLFETIGQSEEYVGRAKFRPGQPTAPQLGHEVVANLFPFIEGAPGVEERNHPTPIAHHTIPSSYSGTMTLAGALFALFAARSRERWFYLGAVIWGLAAAVNAPGVADLLQHLPGFSIAVNDRMVTFAAIGLCALAAIGIDAVAESDDGRLVVCFAAVAIVSAIVSVAGRGSLHGNYVRINAARAVLPTTLAACAAAVVPRRNLVMVLIALLAVQRAGEDLHLQPTLPAKTFYPPFAGRSILQSEAPFRIVATGPLLTPAIATHYGLEDVRGYQALTFARYSATYPMWSARQGVWSNRVDTLAPPILSLLNVRYAITDPHLPLPPAWRIRGTFDTYSIVENTRVLGRAFVPRSVRGASSPRESLAAIRNIPDFAAQGVVENGTHGPSANGPGTVSIAGRGSHMRLRAHMDGPGWVVVSNANWKGWIARERGQQIPIRFADHAFIGFYLGSGDHDVELVYRPRSFVLGAWISAVALALVLAYGAIPSSAITFFMSFQTSFFAEGVRRRYAG